MASINDVYNQLVTVNATLSSMNADVNAGTTATKHVQTSVDQLDTDLKAGFAATLGVLNSAATALNAIWTIEYNSAGYLYHLTQQADAMICALEHISQNTCGLLTQATIQTGLQEKIHHDEDALVAMAQSGNPAGALEFERLAKLQKEIHKCCPPDIPPPACTYTPCPKPKPIGETPLPQPPRVPSQPK